MEINKLCKIAHEASKSKGFYDEKEHHNIGEKLMLIVSELGEAIEAHRESNFAHKDTIREIVMNGCDFSNEKTVDNFMWSIKDTFEDEIADTFIRLFDLCGFLNIDIDTHILLKMRFNSTREIRHGKKY